MPCLYAYVLDAIAAFDQPILFASLRRDVIPDMHECTYSIEKHDGLKVTVHLSLASDAGDDDGFRNTLVIVRVYPGSSGKLEEFSAKEVIPEQSFNSYTIKRLLPALAAPELSIFRITPSTDDIHRYGHHIGKALETLQEELLGLSSYRAGQANGVDRELPFPPVSSSNRRLHISLQDDPGFPNSVSVDRMPSGWKTAASVLCGLNAASDGSICLIEEPETHLHPTLQRALATQISEIAQRKELQLFIATHSPTLLQKDVWGGLTPSLLSVDGREVKPDILGSSLLEPLGVRAADLLQTNGVIWVEGPSDRLYIKAFLENFSLSVSERQGRERVFGVPLEENKHYSFLFFGGSCLSHFGSNDESTDFEEPFSEIDEIIDVLKVNRNAALFVDRDLDFAVDDFGEAFAVNSYGKTKSRVIDSVLSGRDAMAHVTLGYTMEDYLPQDWKKRYLRFHSGRTQVNVNKVKLARMFSEDPEAIKEALKNPGLHSAITKLVQKVARWNGLS